MKYKQLLDLCFDFRDESNNFTNINTELFVDVPKYLYLFRYLFNKSNDEYAKLFDLTYDELNEQIVNDKVNVIDAEKFRETIEIYLKELKEKTTQPNYLEIISDNFLKEENNIILKLKIDRIVDTKYYRLLMVIFAIIFYISLIFIIEPEKQTPLFNLYTLVFSLFLLITTAFIYNRYILKSGIKLIFIANVIQNHLDKNDLKLFYFVKNYLIQISGHGLTFKKNKEIEPLLFEISYLISDINDLIKNKLINQLNKYNFSEVGSILKTIGFQKSDGLLKNYIYIGELIEKYNSKLEAVPYIKPPKYQTTLHYSHNLISNCYKFITNSLSIFSEILPYFFIAGLITSASYIMTNDSNVAGLTFAGICPLLAVVYSKRK